MLIVLLAFVLPVYTYTYQGNSSSSYLFEMFGLSFSSSSVSTGGSLFYGVLVLSMGLIGALLIFSKKDEIKHVGEGFTLAFLAAMIYLSKNVGALKTTASSEYLKIGPVHSLLVTAIVFGLLFLIFSVIVNYFFSSISDFFKNVNNSKVSEKSLEERLTEIETLRSKDLISEEEAKKMKSDIISKEYSE